MLLSGGQKAQALLRRAACPFASVESVKEVTTDLVRLLHHRHGFGLVDGGPAGSTAFSVRRQRLFQLVRQPQVVHHESPGLVAEHPVHPRDGLHEPVGAHGFVHVHGVQARAVEAREPHVADDDDLEGVLRVSKAVPQKLPPLLVPNVRLPFRRIRSRARHHHLDRALVVVLVVPLRAKANNLVVQLYADAAAHANDHCLTVERLEPLFEVVHDILRDQPKSLLRSRDCLQASPFRLQTLLALDLFSLRHLLELFVHPRFFFFGQVELGKSAFIVNRHRCPVFHRPLDVVDGDVVTEDGACVAVVQLKRRPREPDEACIGQGIAHVAGGAAVCCKRFWALTPAGARHPCPQAPFSRLARYG
jgi:hypothetical protein